MLPILSLCADAQQDLVIEEKMPDSRDKLVWNLDCCLIYILSACQIWDATAGAILNWSAPPESLKHFPYREAYKELMENELTFIDTAEVAFTCALSQLSLWKASLLLLCFMKQYSAYIKCKHILYFGDLFHLQEALFTPLKEGCYTCYSLILDCGPLECLNNCDPRDWK